MSVTLDEAEHRYHVDGREVPSVTTVLSPYTGLEYVNRDLLEAAAALGTDVHAAVHLYNTGRLAHCPEHIEPYVDAWRKFLDESGAVVLESEVRVYSAKYGYAGTLDNILHWNDTDTLTDIKSGSVVPKTVGPQTAAYVHAVNEMRGTNLRARRCIHLRPDGTYKVHRLTETTDWSIFLSCLNVWRWRYGL